MKISKEQIRDNKTRVNVFLSNRKLVKEWDEKLKEIAKIIKKASNISEQFDKFNKGLANVKKDVWD